MPTITKTSTSEMEVTSIRFERSLKESLKALAGNQGYQVLIRKILWNYVQQKSGEYRPQFSALDIRSTIKAIARKDEICALTGEFIAANENMWLGLTVYGDFVPLSLNSFSH